MKELYLATENGNVKINQDQIEKYNLKEGGVSPYTKYRIVDEEGNFKHQISEDKKTKTEMPEGEGLEDDEIIEFPDGQILSQSEIIDFSEGTDSSVEGNKDD
ncbi:hypothetical protein J2Z76_001923 [Sedimentibacter acidaminivorans]|uniref:Uncharacterized protein n=1 Tax=Sedimentibacter acidaminivorans TaxID=913099 RepID=A0ABS4GEF1_9FIRM|nr:hypothetical protein [Sedimentibacter acidaminivorans]MBP1926059.1 hypothetical protein [Sedimentibacter acidaminivorans]